ncbi:MAG: hypothetical protein QXD77_00745 [Candidatus Aenigmatarchaeota archaeon]
MAWIVGTRKKKMKLSPEGPRVYTAAVLRAFSNASRSPAERASFARMLRFVEMGKFDEYAAVDGNIGVVSSEEMAVLKLAGFLEKDLTWMDAETKVGGKAAYVRKVRAAFSALAKEVSYQGRWDALASHLVRKAARLYGWEES